MIKQIQILFIALFCLAINVVAQSSSRQQLFPDCGDHCERVARLGANGNIFVYHDNRIYEIDAVTSEITEYNIDSFVPFHAHAFDFVVLADYQVIIAELWTDFRLTLVDLKNNSAVQLVQPITGLFPCGRITDSRYYPTLRSIFLYEENRVLLCSSQSNGAAYLNLLRLEGSRLVFEQNVYFGGYGEVSTYPASWLSILSGLDGKTYVIPRINSSLLDSLTPENVERLGGNTFAVVASESLSQTWSGTIVELPPARPQLTTDINHRYIDLIAIDELGNMYFHEEISNYIASSFIKVRADGRKVWELTEHDLGGIFDSVVVSDSRHATVFFRDNTFLPIDLTEIDGNL